MQQLRISYQEAKKGTRYRATIPSRMLGLFILFLAVVFWPTAVLAADSGVETQRNAFVAFAVIILIVASLAVGLFFVFPLRRRQAAAEEEALNLTEGRTTVTAQISVPHDPIVMSAHPPAAEDLSSFEPPEAFTPAQPLAPIQPPAPTPLAPAQPLAPIQPSVDTSVASIEPDVAPKPPASPWSTGTVQPDANWSPSRRGIPFS